MKKDKEPTDVREETETQRDRDRESGRVTRQAPWEGRPASLFSFSLSSFSRAALSCRCGAQRSEWRAVARVTRSGPH